MILLWLGLKPKTREDGDKLGRGAQALMAADRQLVVKTVADGRTMLGATSEAQLDAAVNRLVHEFDVEAEVTGIDIAYKEALTGSAFGEAKYAKQSGGRSQYAHVRIGVGPGEPGSGFVFDNLIVGGEIPGEFVKPVAEALRECCYRGVLAGYPIEDVRVTLYGGSYHEIDSSAGAFKIAAAMAFANAAKKAQPMLLEPIMRVLLIVPEECVSRVEAMLSSRRGELATGRGEEEWPTIGGRFPLSETFGLCAAVRQRTGGRGICDIRFAHYAPAARTGEDGDPDTAVREPKHPRTPPGILRAAVPEPEDDAYDDDEIPPTASPRSHSEGRGR